jgi:hypothetical protein
MVDRIGWALLLVFLVALGVLWFKCSADCDARGGKLIPGWECIDRGALR